MGRKSIVGQTALRVSFVYCFVLLALAGGFTVYITTYMRNQILKSRAAEVVLATDIYDSKLEAMVEPIISLGEYAPTGRLAAGYYEKYTKEWMAGIRSLDAYLLNVSMFNRFVADVNLLDKEGHSCYSMNDLLRADYAYGEAKWFQRALSRPGVVKCAPPHGSDHLYSRNREKTFSLIYPIRRQSSTLGYILLEVSLPELTQFLGQTEEGFSYVLLSEEGELIYATQSPFDDSSQEEVLLSSQEEILLPSPGRGEGWGAVFWGRKRIPICSIAPLPLTAGPSSSPAASRSSFGPYITSFLPSLALASLPSLPSLASSMDR